MEFLLEIILNSHNYFEAYLKEKKDKENVREKYKKFSGSQGIFK